MKHFRMQRWALAAVLAVSLYLPAIDAEAAEADHLKGYKARDLNQIPAPANPYVVGDETCNLRRPLYVLAASAKNGGDDPRGGPAVDFVCYRADCGPPPYDVVTADSQFGVHQLERRRTKIVCLPIDKHVCGDNEVDPGEECDGTDATACPGYCSWVCGCPAAACPSSGGNPLGCQNQQSDLFCNFCCNEQGGCPACVTAAASSCTNPSDNDQCGAELNAMGCADICCN